MIYSLLEINSDDIIVQSLGAFLGFLFALILALISSFIRRRIEIAKIKNSLRVELNEFISDFEKPELLSYSTPVWDSIISTGSLLSFLIFPKKETIKNFLVPIGEVYAEIKLLDELEKSIYLNSRAIEITDEVKNKRNDIKDLIDKLEFMKN